MAGVAGQSVEIQVARCPTEYRGGVAVADCRAVSAADAPPMPVAEAVAVEMVPLPVVGQRARSVEDAAVDDAMDALFRRGLIPANEPRS